MAVIYTFSVTIMNAMLLRVILRRDISQFSKNIFSIVIAVSYCCAFSGTIYLTGMKIPNVISLLFFNSLHCVVQGVFLLTAWGILRIIGELE